MVVHLAAASVTAEAVVELLAARGLLGFRDLL
jgi:hypothetical protein